MSKFRTNFVRNFLLIKRIGMSRYSLENLWNFSDLDIQKILQYFGTPILNTPADKLNAVIVSFNHNILEPGDRSYVTSPYFNQLFLAPDSELASLAGSSAPQSHVAQVKYIIDQMNKIPMVSQIPTEISQPIALYQMGENIYVCGRGTYNLRERLRTLGGTWNPNVKCWSFPLTARTQLLDLLTIPSTIPSISQVPATIPGNLQIYQMGGEVLVCGTRTYDLQDRLRAIGGTFSRNVGCWVFPATQAQAVLNLMNEIRQEDVQYQETQLKFQEEAQTRAREAQLKAQQERQTAIQEEAARANRLKIPEPEAPYTPHINRIAGQGQALENQAKQEDAVELKALWGDKIKIVRTLPGTRSVQSAIVTYTGDLKPPNLALALAADDWRPFNFGWRVQRVDYKTYRVDINID